MGMNNIKTVYMNNHLYFTLLHGVKVDTMVGLKSNMATNAKPRGEWFPQKSGLHQGIHCQWTHKMTYMAKRVH